MGTARSDLIRQPNRDHLPGHVAIIMDGNGRWARMRGLPRIAGHRRGILAVHEVVEIARELGIAHLTLYAFSAENWQRPATEVRQLMGLLERYLRKELATLKERGIRFRTIGALETLPPRVLAWIRTVQQETEPGKEMTLTIALSYSGRAELIEAMRRMASEVQRGRLRPEEIDEMRFAHHLNTDGLPDPDLMIRTSGESRISNFMLWQMAYTELYFTKTLWPDFGKRDFFQAILDYQQRERRFGQIGEVVS